jgi:ABC-2 type transport system permease protein
MLNFTAFTSLYKKETLRFIKIYHQSIFTPVVNALLFFVIFVVAIPKTSSGGVLDRSVIVATGIIMMSVIQNAYTNCSSSIAMAKILGYVTDYLMPPITKTEIALAVMSAGVTRGLCVFASAWLSLCFMCNLGVHSIFMMAFYLVISSAVFALVGIIFGSISSNFDQNHAYNTYIITPLTFLSGTFYSIAELPPIWKKIAQYNPVFYIIDGFRYSVTGYTDSKSIFIGVFVMIGLFFTSLALAVFALKKNLTID